MNIVNVLSLLVQDKWWNWVFRYCTFVGLMFLTMTLFPYVVTNETYQQPSQRIHGSFPVAVLVEGKPKIVSWTEYQENLARYEHKVLLGDVKKNYVLDEFVHFDLTPDGGNVFRIDYHAEDYRFWSTYAVSDGIVRPISFRFTGAFAGFYALFIALAGTSLVNWARKRHQARLALY